MYLDEDSRYLGPRWNGEPKKNAVSQGEFAFALGFFVLTILLALLSFGAYKTGQRGMAESFMFLAGMTFSATLCVAAYVPYKKRLPKRKSA